MFVMMCYRYVNTCYQNFLPNTTDFGTENQYTILFTVKIVCKGINIFSFFMFKAWTVGDNYQENKILQKEPVIKRWFTYLQCKLNLFILAFFVCLWSELSVLFMLLDGTVVAKSVEYLMLYFSDVYMICVLTAAVLFLRGLQINNLIA